MTMTEHERLVRRFEAAVAKHGKVPQRLPLPFKTRLRLRATHRVNVVGCWLVERGQVAAAEWLWRACGMW